MSDQQLRIGELRSHLTAIKADWAPPPHLADDDPVPIGPTGVDTSLLTVAADVPPLDLRAVTDVMPAVPDLRARIKAMALPVAGGPQPLAGGPRSVSVDWRQRFGWRWITTVQDQGQAASCWVFAAVALIDAMTRIEHCTWFKGSEGDVHDGLGAHRDTTGEPGRALTWVKDHGVCDLAEYPYHEDGTWTPAADRDGRTVRIGDHVLIGDVEEQKTWIDTVGPLAACFSVYADFAPGTGVYHKTALAGNNPGGHCVLIVGYDDTPGVQAWICKNSWGPAWGDAGYFRIGYGEAEIDHFAKYGLRNTNPDPWSKRRQHNGGVLESGNGAAHRNFELSATAGTRIQMWWREGDPPFPWAKAADFADDAAACPTLFQTTYGRNLELIYPTTGNRLHHWWFGQTDRQWHDGGVFGPPDAAGIPAIIQSDYGQPGNLEVVVRTADDRLNHWWRRNGPPWTWTDGGRFSSGIAASGAALVQTRHRNLEMVAVCRDGTMQFLWRDDANGFVWHEGESFGAGVSSPPCMIEGQFGAVDENTPGNYELCVAVAGRVQHWWKQVGSTAWVNSATFGHDVQAVVGLVEGSFGYNLEAVVLRVDGGLQHYWRDGAGWHEGPVFGSI